MKKKLIGIFVILIGLILTSCDFVISKPERLLDNEIEEYSDCQMIVFYRMDDEYENRENELEGFKRDYYYYTLSEFMIEIELNESVYKVVPVYVKGDCGNRHYLCEKDGVLYGWNDVEVFDIHYEFIKWEKEEGKTRETFRGWWKSKYPSSEFTVYNFNYYD